MASLQEQRKIVDRLYNEMALNQQEIKLLKKQNKRLRERVKELKGKIDG